jgi:hypothetical protein
MIKHWSLYCTGSSFAAVQLKIHSNTEQHLDGNNIHVTRQQKQIIPCRVKKMQHAVLSVPARPVSSTAKPMLCVGILYLATAAHG